jgi:hypothetical protein
MPLQQTYFSGPRLARIRGEAAHSDIDNPIDLAAVDEAVERLSD